MTIPFSNSDSVLSSMLPGLIEYVQMADLPCINYG